MDLEPDKIKDSLTKDQYNLYKLIWSRFVASRMAAAVYDGVAVTIKNSDYTLKANGTKMVFDGYTKIYNNVSEEDINKILPDMDEGMNLSLKEIKSEQSFTQGDPIASQRCAHAFIVEDGVHTSSLINSREMKGDTGVPAT